MRSMRTSSRITGGGGIRGLPLPFVLALTAVAFGTDDDSADADLDLRPPLEPVFRAGLPRLPEPEPRALREPGPEPELRVLREPEPEPELRVLREPEVDLPGLPRLPEPRVLREPEPAERAPGLLDGGRSPLPDRRRFDESELERGRSATYVGYPLGRRPQGARRTSPKRPLEPDRSGSSVVRNPAATYSPRPSPTKYHRRWRA